MLSKEQLKQILVSQNKSLQSKPFGIQRMLLHTIQKKTDLPHIIVLTGIRRCGKSTLLKQIIEKVYDNKNYYYINFEDERLFHFKAEQFNDLYESLVDLYGECNTFFIDEIQNISNFESFVRRFYDRGFKFYITGSNARLLSNEIGSKLTGRHMDIIVKPFSFEEFLLFKKVSFEKNMLYLTETRVQIKKLFEEYLEKGGMPEYLKHNDIEILTMIYEDIIMKDVAIRFHIDDITTLRDVYHYLINTFSNKFSYNSIKNMIGIGSVNTVKKYISHLEETFFIKTVNKFDHSVKKQLVNNKKIYLLDNGFIQAISTRLTSDRGWFLENLVFNILNNQYTDVFYFSHTCECDFVVIEKKNITAIIQVCWELTEKNEKREIDGLISAIDYFNQNEGLILTYDQENELMRNNKKIKIKPVWKWILEQKVY